MLLWCLEGMRAKMRAEKELLQTLYLAIYVNDYHPVLTSSIDDFIEADFSGYERVKLDRWGTPFISSPDTVSLVEIVRTFTWDATGPAPLVFGYYVIDKEYEHYYFGERRAEGPFQFGPSDLTLDILPVMRVRNMT